MNNSDKNLLLSMPNIGPVLAYKLAAIGIDSPDKLLNREAKQVFLELRAYDREVCLCTLYALEGAIRNVRWHTLTTEKKQELKVFFNQLSKQWK